LSACSNREDDMTAKGRPVQFAASGNIVAETRRMLGLKQSELAELLKVTTMAVSLWETGKRQVPGPVEILCKLLQRDPCILPVD